jgi:hypothetical protein
MLETSKRIQLTKTIGSFQQLVMALLAQLLLADGVLNGKEWGAKPEEFLIACPGDLNPWECVLPGPQQKSQGIETELF